MTTLSNPRVYCLVRTDMASMTVGRIAAQCHHAGQVFERFIETTNRKNTNQELIQALRQWRGIHQIGTCITLNGGSLENMMSFYNQFHPDQVCSYVDPEYHLRDGGTTFIVPYVPTVIMIFAYKQEHVDKLKTLELL